MAVTESTEAAVQPQEKIRKPWPTWAKRLRTLIILSGHRGGRIVRTVTIEVTNPGAITAGSTATASAGCAASASFTCKTDKAVLSRASGKIKELHAAEGDLVNENQLLVTLSNDTLRDQLANANDQIASASDQVRNARLNLEIQLEALNNYSVHSPIEGNCTDSL